MTIFCSLAIIIFLVQIQQEPCISSLSRLQAHKPASSSHWCKSLLLLFHSAFCCLSESSVFQPSIPPKAHFLGKLHCVLCLYSHGLLFLLPLQPNFRFLPIYISPQFSSSNLKHDKFIPQISTPLLVIFLCLVLQSYPSTFLHPVVQTYLESSLHFGLVPIISSTPSLSSTVTSSCTPLVLGPSLF